MATTNQLKFLIMEKDNKTMEHAYVEITDDKMAEMEDVLRKMGNLDEIDPKVIVHELIRRGFRVSFNEVVAKDSFSGRYNEIASSVSSYIKSCISLGKPVLTGWYLEYASSDYGFYEDCVVREEVRNGVMQFWFAAEYDPDYDYDEDVDGIVSGPYRLDDLDLSEVTHILASNDKNMEKYMNDLDKLIKDAFKILDAMKDFKFLKKPLMVSIDCDGKWCNELIYNVYKRHIYGASFFTHFHCSYIGYADLMNIVDAVLEHTDK